MGFCHRTSSDLFLFLSKQTSRYNDVYIMVLREKGSDMKKHEQTFFFILI